MAAHHDWCPVWTGDTDRRAAASGTIRTLVDKWSGSHPCIRRAGEFDDYYELPAGLVETYEATQAAYRAAEQAILDHIADRHLQAHDPMEDATCGFCGHAMNGTACTTTTAVIVKVEGDDAPPGDYRRLPYSPGPGPATNCWQCGTPRDYLHHYGCSMEDCPVPGHVDREGRGLQAISDGCRWEGDE